MKKSNNGENLESAVNEGAVAVAGSGRETDTFLRDLIRCLKPLKTDYGFREYKLPQLRESTPLLKEFLNKYFTVDDD